VVVVGEEQVNDNDACISNASPVSESLLSNCHAPVITNDMATVSTTLSSPSRTVVTGEKPPTQTADVAGYAVADVGEMGRETADVARCEDDDTDDTIVVDATSDCHQLQSDAAAAFALNNNNNNNNNNDIIIDNNNKTQQSLSSSPCCALDATRLSATTFHGDTALSHFRYTTHLTPGQ